MHKAQKIDEYAEITRSQNLGAPCPYCHADIGHFGKCELLNRTFPTTAPEIKISPSAQVLIDRISHEAVKIKAELPEMTEGDHIILHSLGVSWVELNSL